MSNVIPFKAKQRIAANARQAEQRRKDVEEAGNHAWGKLKKTRRKLSENERNEFAKAMHWELETLERIIPKFSRGQLAVAAELSADPNSKELYRLTLPPGADPNKRGLRAEPDKYTRLLKAIQRKTGENILQMADRLTWATSFHPKQAQDADESEKMMNMLQEIINRVDREFVDENGGKSLFATFMKTASTKAEMARQSDLLKITRIGWPFYDEHVEDYIDVDDHQEFGSSSSGVTIPLDYQLLPEDIFETRFAFWQREYLAHTDRLSRQSANNTYSSNVSHFDALMNLPRIYLGVVDADSVHNRGCLEESRQYCETNPVMQCKAEPGYRLEQIEYLKSLVGGIGEIRDPETGEACIAHQNPETGVWVQGLSGEYDGNHYYVDDCAHVWLVIYPSPDNTTLLPVLYQPMAEGGTLLIPLHQRSLISLREMYFVDEGEPRSLYDRIKELLGQSSDRAIYKAWQETAKDLLNNPILKAHKKALVKQDDFDLGKDDLWGVS